MSPAIAIANLKHSQDLLQSPSYAWFTNAMKAEADKLIEQLINGDDGEIETARLRARIRTLRQWIAFPAEQRAVAADQLRQEDDAK